MSPAMATALHAHPSSLDLSGDTHTRPSGRGWRDLAGEPRWCAQRRPERGPTVQASGTRCSSRCNGCNRDGRIGEPPPCGGWGEPEPGRRSLQQRGEPARSGVPRPDGLDM